MIAETINFIDYNGVRKEEVHHFHLSNAELLEMELGTVSGFTAWIQSIRDANDNKTLIGIFKDVLLKSYGKKTLDGRFEKKQEYRDEFQSSNAFTELYVKLASSAEFSSKFMNGIVEVVAEKVETPATTN